MIIPIDHGNSRIKTERVTFYAGYKMSKAKPKYGKDYIFYNDYYYTLVHQKEAVREDKTVDDNYFILTLFGLAYEISQNVPLNRRDSNGIIDVQMPACLPPNEYAAEYMKFEKFFTRTEPVHFVFNGFPLAIRITECITFLQAHAAAMTLYDQIKDHPRVYIVDIGGGTVIYLWLKYGQPQEELNDVIPKKGINHFQAELALEFYTSYRTRIEWFDIDTVISLYGMNHQSEEYRKIRENLEISDEGIRFIHDAAQRHADGILYAVRERGIDYKNGKTIMIGGGNILLHEFIKPSQLLGNTIFLSKDGDERINAKGLRKLYNIYKETEKNA